MAIASLSQLKSPRILVAVVIAVLVGAAGVVTASRMATRTKPCEPTPLTDSVLEALQRTSSKFSVGLTYVELRTALGDADYALGRLAKSAEPDRDPELNRTISEAFAHYRFGARVWALKFEGRCYLKAVMGSITDEEKKRYFGDTPDASAETYSALETLARETTGDGKTLVDLVVRSVLGRAGEFTEQADSRHRSSQAATRS